MIDKRQKYSVNSSLDEVLSDMSMDLNENDTSPKIVKIDYGYEQVMENMSNATGGETATVVGFRSGIKTGTGSNIQEVNSRMTNTSGFKTPVVVPQPHTKRPPQQPYVEPKHPKPPYEPKHPKPPIDPRHPKQPYEPKHPPYPYPPISPPVVILKEYPSTTGKCPDGYHFDPTSAKRGCVADNIPCPEGYVLDKETNRCIKQEGTFTCPEHSTKNSEGTECYCDSGYKPNEAKDACIEDTGAEPYTGTGEVSGGYSGSYTTPETVTEEVATDETKVGDTKKKEMTKTSNTKYLLALGIFAVAVGAYFLLKKKKNLK